MVSVRDEDKKCYNIAYNSEKVNQTHKVLRLQGEWSKLIKALLFNIRLFSYFQ